MTDSLGSRLKAILEQAGPATVIAVSKTKPVESMIELYRCGHRDFGENYVQELVEKAKRFSDLGLTDARFHFIGHLQTNKVKHLMPWVFAIHSVDSSRLLEAIEKEAGKCEKKIQCYFQINIDAEETKSGFSVSELNEVAQRAVGLKWVIPAGLMVIPNPELDSSKAFQRTQVLSKKWSDSLGKGLSMGMSEDFQSAIRCGATIVRVGSAIFGART